MAAIALLKVSSSGYDVSNEGRAVMVMPVRVPVRPELLDWAVDRIGWDEAEAASRFPRLADWRDADPAPTFKQLEGFARAARVPLGYLFLAEPPVEQMPIPDFRTVANAGVQRPSPDLLDTIYECQGRQEWYRDFAQSQGDSPLPFVGSVTESDSVVEVANTIRESVRFGLADRSKFPNWEDARRRLIDEIEDLGVLVMISGYVGGNTHRTLDPQEFRGFTLSDPLAPLIFVNGADSKAAQIFTLIHELAHVWAGHTGLSDANISDTNGSAREVWANRVAAEVLLPLSVVESEYSGSVDVPELQRLARRYKVSTLVVLGRVRDAGLISWELYLQRFAEERARVQEILKARQATPGGNWHYSQPLKISRTFARAVITDAMEGRTLFRDAYALLGTSRHETFQTLAETLGVA